MRYFIKENGKRKLCVLAILLVIWGVWLPSFAVPVSSANYDADWRRVLGTPTIAFADADGNWIEDIGMVSLTDPELSFDSSKVTYGELKNLEYSTVILNFSYVDYNFPCTEEQLPSEDQIVVELEFNDTVYAADLSMASVSDKGYLMLDSSFEYINFFDDIHNDFTLYMQYPRLSANGDISRDVAKGSIQYTIPSLSTPNAPSDEEEDTVPPTPIIEIQTKEEEALRTYTPYILIEDCKIGDELTAVSAGSSFDITLTCRNSHRRMYLDNVLMQVTVPDELRLDHSSNSFYIDHVEQQGDFTQAISLIASPEAAAGNYAIDIKFSYEYIEEDIRRWETMSQKIVVPIVQGARFETADIAVRPEYVVGKEFQIYSAFSNQSRGKLYNVSAQLESELICDKPVQYLGNLSEGESGTVDFKLLALQAGISTGKVLYTYENAAGQVFHKESTFDLNLVDPPVEEAEEPKDEPLPSATQVMTIPMETEVRTDMTPVYVSLAFTAVVIVIFVIALKRQKEEK